MECPQCGHRLELLMQTYNIPYFGMVLQSTFICHCGYKFVDIYPFEVKEPTRYIVHISNADLNSRVVKSSTCIIEVPELGIRVDPGPASEGVVTNIEGILRRIEDVLKTAIRWGNPDQKRKGKRILKKLRKVFEGKESVTLILEDPRGFSCIVSENVKREPL
ncbi:MAG: ZPR1 zinc finger domain-containing protein [Theionarchaea archaeon]|nr:ZPR1 zinc finger domain-containing protein [Theionarchaea archaeon]